MSELRWHPLLQEWVVIATQRQTRTFLPAADQCPLCPTTPGGLVTEIPAPTYDIVVFENRFPSLSRPPEPASIEGTALYPVLPADGVCEVIAYTPEHRGTLADQSLERVTHLIRVWRHRYEDLAAQPGIQYVLIFENKGTAIGVTLEHPHGQIYAYPFIPPIPAREQSSLQQHKEQTGRCLVCDVVSEEVKDRRRIVYESERFVAAIPFFARWPYEVHIWSRRHIGSLSDFTTEEDIELASAILHVTRAYDRLPGFDPPFPYMMVIHQRPTTGGTDDESHFHVEFYPPFRYPGRLKYLAGESGGGTFVNDTQPEEKADQLRIAMAGVEVEP